MARGSIALHSFDVSFLQQQPVQFAAIRKSLVLAFFLVAQLAVAQGLTVVYMEGEADLQSGSSWVQLALGKAVPPNSSIRLTPGGLLQLKGAGVELTFSRPGSYVIRAVLAEREKISSAGAGAALLSSLRSLVFGPVTRSDANLGARGANESKPQDQGWAESTAEVFLDAGKEYVKAGKYVMAIEQLREALQSATEQEAPEIRYYLAYASSLNGDAPEAWKQISAIHAGSEPWAGDFILLKAKLLEDSIANEDAVAWLTQDGNDLSRDSDRAPLYYFLLGLGYRGSGDGEKALQALSKVVSISATSDLGKAARELSQQP
ncbi:MAG: hypothetical protein ABSG17_09520 [Spirochaetia bacterium]